MPVTYHNLGAMNYVPQFADVTGNLGMSVAFTWSKAPKGTDFWLETDREFLENATLSPEAVHLLDQMKDIHSKGYKGFYYDSETGEITVKEEEKVQKQELLVGRYYHRACQWAYFDQNCWLYVGDGVFVDKHYYYHKEDCHSKFKILEEVPEDKQVVTKTNFGNLFEFARQLNNFEHTRYDVADYLGDMGIHSSTKQFERTMCAQLYSPEVSKDGITIFKTYKDFLKGRKTTMKFGRAMKWMFEGLTDAETENTVKFFKDRYTERNLTLHTGQSREQFKHAYGGSLAKSKNPRTTASRKSLHNSCMRGVLAGGISPAEVYASGDFHIAWLEDEEGNIAGRVVVLNDRNGRPQAGPVYGCCEQSLDMLEDYLKFIDAVLERDGSSWDGAKLLHLEASAGIVAPYSDMEEEAEISHCGYYLILGRGDIELTQTNGYALGCGSTCSNCGESCHEDELTYIEGHGDVCEHCIDYGFSWDEEFDTYIPGDVVVTINYRHRGYTHGMVVHQDSDLIVYCDCVQEDWHADYVTFSEHMDEYVPSHLVDDFPEYFPEEQEEEGEAA